MEIAKQILRMNEIIHYVSWRKILLGKCSGKKILFLLQLLNLIFLFPYVYLMSTGLHESVWFWYYLLTRTFLFVFIKSPMISVSFNMKWKVIFIYNELLQIWDDLELLLCRLRRQVLVLNISLPSCVLPECIWGGLRPISFWKVEHLAGSQPSSADVTALSWGAHPF